MIRRLFFSETRISGARERGLERDLTSTKMMVSILSISAPFF